MTLVIMAAGMGSRFGGLKQIEPVGPSGEFILDYSVYDAIRAGFKKIIFIIKEENHEIFRSTVGNRIEDKIDVEYVFQKIDDIPNGFVVPEKRIKPWGTGHAILSARKAVKDNFVVINADDFYGKEAYQVAKEFFNKENSDIKEHFCMVSYKVSNTLTENGEVARGICEKDSDGFLTKLTEAKVKRVDSKIKAYNLVTKEDIPVDEDQLVSMNIWGFTTKMLDFLNNRFTDFFIDNVNNLDTAEYLLPNIVSEIIDEKLADVKVLKSNAKWHGITYKEDKKTLIDEINKLVEKGEYPKNLWK